jgi:hypothetical protein
MTPKTEIWTSGNFLILRFDGAHEVKLPINDNTITVLLSVLRSREGVQAGVDTYIGKKPSPTQYDLDLVLKAMGSGKVKIVGPKRAADENITLEDLGL